jgi:hypothetical protein
LPTFSIKGKSRWGSGPRPVQIRHSKVQMFPGNPRLLDCNEVGRRLHRRPNILQGFALGKRRNKKPA